MGIYCLDSAVLSGAQTGKGSAEERPNLACHSRYMGAALLGVQRALGISGY